MQVKSVGFPPIHPLKMRHIYVNNATNFGVISGTKCRV